MKLESEKVVLIDPEKIITPNIERLEVNQPLWFESRWQTPGLYLAQRIANNPQVHFIGDKIYMEYIQTIIVIDNDPEELLDKILSLEQEIYKRFEGLRFDLRIRVIPSKDDINTIKNSTIIQYDRDRFIR